MKELRRLKADHEETEFTTNADERNTLCWNATIQGPTGTKWDGLTLHLYVGFGTPHPDRPPGCFRPPACVPPECAARRQHLRGFPGGRRLDTP
jgi:ubiquitin-protein ligase